ncbi:MAG: hypothetical protein MUE52_04940 [Tabrizicola sp.]|nr:hypothetical protein [Tabrizicola sp.]
MSDIATQVAARPKPILLTDWTGYRTDPAQAFARAVALPGQSRLRLIWRLVRSSGAPMWLTQAEFFRMGLYRPELSWDDIRTYIGQNATGRFNRLLNGPTSENETEALNDKLETASRLAAAGIKVAEVNAIYPGSLRWGKAEPLNSVEDMTAYLLRPGSTPCFGKPIFGGLCRGVVAIELATTQGRLLLGDGREVDARQLATELVAAYGQGYMFQELLRASDQIRPLSGPVLPVLRVYSVWVGGDVQAVYAALRLPSPGAMSDDDAKPGCIRALVDMQDGHILRAHDMAKEYGEPTTHSATGLAFAGWQLADMAEAIATAKEVHRQFPKHRSLGSDIGLSQRGFVVNEANASPVHLTYQLTASGGLLNPDLRPLFREALAERGIRGPQKDTPWQWH